MYVIISATSNGKPQSQVIVNESEAIGMFQGAKAAIIQIEGGVPQLQFSSAIKGHKDAYWPNGAFVVLHAHALTV